MHLPHKILSLLTLYRRAINASIYASGRGLSGIEFNHFGRNIGWHLVRKVRRDGIDYLLNPVSSVRYFEFPFTLSCLPKNLGNCLDVSSPRLFSLYAAKNGLAKNILMINPDHDDITRTSRIASNLGINNISIRQCSVHDIIKLGKTFDCIWTISVIEHISGEYDDQDAIKILYSALNPGGRLILTIPVDRVFWNEYRSHDYYGLQKQESGQGNYFFQRFYDKQAIQDRLLSPIGKQPTKISWFGEITPGRFQSYIARWIREGYHCVVEDPREIVDNYRYYSCWEEMPGMGICGLMVQKT